MNGLILILRILVLTLSLLALPSWATDESCESLVQKPVEWEITPNERDQIVYRHRHGGEYDALPFLNGILMRAQQAGHIDGNLAEQIQYEERLLHNLQTLRIAVERMKTELSLKTAHFGWQWRRPELDKIAEDYSVFMLEEILGTSLWDMAREQLEWAPRLKAHGLDVEMYDFERQAVVIQGLWNQFLTAPAIADTLLQHLEVLERTTSRVYRDFCAPIIHYRQNVLGAIGIKTTNSRAQAIAGRFTTWKFSAGEIDDIETAAKRDDESLDETLNRVVERSLGLNHAESAPQIRYERTLLSGLRTLRHMLASLNEARRLSTKKIFGRSRAELAVHDLIFKYTDFMLDDTESDSLAHVARVQMEFFQPEDRESILGDTTGKPPADYRASLARARESWGRLQHDGITSHLIDSQDLKELMQELELFEHSSEALYQQRCAQLIAYRQDILNTLGIENSRPARRPTF